MGTATKSAKGISRTCAIGLERLDIANNDMGKNEIQLKGDSEVTMLVDCGHGPVRSDIVE